LSISVETLLTTSLLSLRDFSLLIQKVQQQSLPSDTYIKPITETIGGGRMIIHSVNFYLDPSLIQRLNHLQHRQQPLLLLNPLRNTLRQYHFNGGQGNLQTGLTFYTHLDQQPIIKSYIASDGEMIHQLHHRCLDAPESALGVFQVHCWLIKQILTQMSWRRTHILKYIFWFIAGLLSLITLLFLPPILWLFLLPFLWLLQREMQSFVRFTLQRWIWRQLLRGKASRQNLAWRLLQL
jgi:hypothetical protein